MLIYEQKHRLPIAQYIGFNVIAFTCCVQNKKNLFIDREIFRTFNNILLEVLEEYNCDAHVYLFMPNHMHLILQGKNDTADMWKCLVLFKQKTGYWLLKNAHEFKWQKDFYDHVLRKDDDLIKQIKYVLNNPVRKGMVSDWKDFLYKGSTVYDFSSWS